MTSACPKDSFGRSVLEGSRTKTVVINTRPEDPIESKSTGLKERKTKQNKLSKERRKKKKKGRSHCLQWVRAGFEGRSLLRSHHRGNLLERLHRSQFLTVECPNLSPPGQQVLSKLVPKHRHENNHKEASERDEDVEEDTEALVVRGGARLGNGDGEDERHLGRGQSGEEDLASLVFQNDLRNGGVQ